MLQFFQRHRIHGFVKVNIARQNLCRPAVYSTAAARSRKLNDDISVLSPYEQKSIHQVMMDIQEARSSYQSAKLDLTDSIIEEKNTRESPEALFGRKKLGWVMLPEWLNSAVSNILADYDDKLLQMDTIRIYDSLRSTTGYTESSLQKYDSQVPMFPQCKMSNEGFKKSLTDVPIHPHILSYGVRESMAYIAGLLPITFGPIYNVLTELSRRIPTFTPRNILDFGTGPGTAIWASHEIWGKNVENYMGIDVSEAMIKMAETLSTYQVGDEGIRNVEFTQYLSYKSNEHKHDMVISAFTFNELPTEQVKNIVLETLWKSTQDILVLIERGTPAGFQAIAHARQKILQMENKKTDSNTIADAGTTVGLVGAHVVAPCPHDGVCPLLNTRNWCHFSQKVNRPTFLMNVKGAKLNFENSKYSYVILRKGPRPTVNLCDSQQSDYIDASYEWPRLVAPPMKRHGHVIMDYCSKTGHIERMIIPKSQGKIPYKDARKVAWGDLFPHSPKKPATRRWSQSELESDLDGLDDESLDADTGEVVSELEPIGLSDDVTNVEPLPKIKTKQRSGKHDKRKSQKSKTAWKYEPSADQLSTRGQKHREALEDRRVDVKRISDEYDYGNYEEYDDNIDIDSYRHSRKIE
ncbi:4998_t:CDS:10 [Paraglomus occultum]|uniref:4998_t:CDS:1 n=1 Tax=Paraglomus occultum TaxID=144539 RepID=A0A9N9BRN5_9GLOM|nr:4998_t:CDS:10 [Paraglomus occultum]